MKLLLRTDVDGVGHKGDIVDVADGFGRNYLVPKGLAITATDGTERQAAAMRRARAVRDAADRAGAEEIARDLVSKRIEVVARSGAEGKLFGSVTATDLVDAVKAQTGFELDRKHVQLAEPIKTVGEHLVPLRLHSDVQITLTVDVTGS